MYNRVQGRLLFCLKFLFFFFFLSILFYPVLVDESNERKKSELERKKKRKKKKYARKKKKRKKRKKFALSRWRLVLLKVLETLNSLSKAFPFLFEIRSRSTFGHMGKLSIPRSRHRTVGALMADGWCYSDGEYMFARTSAGTYLWESKRKERNVEIVIVNKWTSRVLRIWDSIDV